jgi:hypothetical protein
VKEPELSPEKEEEARMTTPSRRSVLRTSLGATAAGTLVWPYIANAAATTATVWWVQGSAVEEDISFKKIVAEYEKASGNTIDYSIMPYAPLRQKIVSAVTSGVVPDLFQNTPAEIIALYAWQDKLVDRQRRRRDATGGIHRNRAADGPLLQQCREEAQHLRCALYRRRFDEPHLAAIGREGRLPDVGASYVRAGGALRCR